MKSHKSILQNRKDFKFIFRLPFLVPFVPFSFCSFFISSIDCKTSGTEMVSLKQGFYRQLLLVYSLLKTLNRHWRKTTFLLSEPATICPPPPPPAHAILIIIIIMILIIIIRSMRWIIFFLLMKQRVYQRGEMLCALNMEWNKQMKSQICNLFPQGVLSTNHTGSISTQETLGFVSGRNNSKPGPRSWRKFIYTYSSSFINLRVCERKGEVESIREVCRTNERTNCRVEQWANKIPSSIAMF